MDCFFRKGPKGRRSAKVESEKAGQLMKKELEWLNRNAQGTYW